MMRIGQHSPSIPDKSAQVRETASPATQKTAPAAPLASTPPTAGTGLPPVQSHFSAPVRPSASAKGSGFVTPPPPAKGKAGAKVSPGQLKQAATTAFTMVHGREPDADELKTLEDKAQTLADKGEDYTSIKFALHGELTAAKGGAPASGTEKLTPEHLKQAVSTAYEMVHSRQPSPSELKTLMGKAQKLADKGEDFDSIKFGLHSEILSEKTGEPPITSASSSAAGSAATDAIKQSIFGGAMGMPSSLGASSALFGKTASVKVSSSTPAPSQAPLRQAVDDAHQLVFGMKASGSSAQELMTHAQGLSATHGNDAGAIRTALHSLLTGKSASAGSSPAPLSKDRLTQAVNEAHQLVFGANPSAAKAMGLMGRALEMAGQLKHDFHALKFALHSQMSGKPMPAPGAAHAPPTDTQLRQTLDDAHQVAFKQAAGGPHLGAWMDEARQLAAQHGNDLQAVKLALHSRMLEAK